MHVGCDEVLTEEAQWREHVLSAHHGLQSAPTVDDETIRELYEGIWQSNGGDGEAEEES